jgi:hypothetical protein
MLMRREEPWSILFGGVVKTMAAKWDGVCADCGVSFSAGDRIAFDGKPHHVGCVEALRAQERAELAEEDARNRAFQEKSAAEWKAGLRVRSTATDKEIIVEGAPDYEMAKAEAFAFVYSVRAAGGTARLIKHKRGGKWYLGRARIHYYEGSNIPDHRGWAFPYEVNGKAA